MPPNLQRDIDSDDDESIDEKALTSTVLLGVPDGIVEQRRDLLDPRVSRIGGRPAFVKRLCPPRDSAQCLECSKAMELLVQLWCPMEGSPMDRVLYVWGCSRVGCQHKGGSVRVFRGLSYNSRYAEKLAQKAERNKLAGQLPSKSSVPNPFSPANISVLPVGLGSELFVAKSHTEPEATSSLSTSVSSGSTSELSDEDLQLEDLSNRFEGIPINSSPWDDVSMFKAIYLATVNESWPPPRNYSDTFNAENSSAEQDASGWKLESYENSLSVDPVFEKFTRRVSVETEQCVRYDLNGVPLPFQTDSVHQKLFLECQEATPSSTSPQYNVAAVSPCPHCGRRRVFECQLMPNLLNNLSKPAKDDDGERGAVQSEDERRIELQRLVGGMNAGVSAHEITGMEWGACLIFSCEADCCDGGDHGVLDAACWREEVALVQWDS